MFISMITVDTVALPLEWSIINFVLDTLTAILFDLNHLGTFVNSEFTNSISSSRFELHAMKAVLSVSIILSKLDAE
jgi:hypothetical protein